ncbi:alkene reductase [uncultured Mesonia sp.]|uniref:alkene reductase n=1 Tax=uncultured Mesonia sp. TaxID=399731 RepID=UPI00374EAF49
MKQPILEPFDLNGLQLANRVVMAPMTRSRANNDNLIPTTDLHGKYYEQRASAGLIISEGVNVSPQGAGYIYVPGIYNESQVEAWQKVTHQIHEAKGVFFMQLWHVGRISHPDFLNGEKPLAPSAINPNTQSFTPEGMKDTVTPKAMTLEDIERTKNDFVQAAKNAFRANCDGIEIHSSNGYLFQQFFNKCSNVRDDQYGGSIENRARFFFEVLDAVIREVPENQVGVRFNPSAHNIFGIEIDEETIPTFEYIIKRLNNYNLAYVHLSEPFTDVSEVPYAVSNIAEHFRPLYQGNLMINGGFDQQKGNEFLEKKLADLICYGKPFISNPDLVERFKENLPSTDWDKETFYTQGSLGYTDYPIVSKSHFLNKI